MYSLVVFTIFSELCSHDHTLISDPLKLPVEKTCTHQQLVVIPATTSRVCFGSLGICLLWTFHIYGIIQYVGLCDWLLSFSTICSGSVYVVACTDTSCFKCWIITHCADIPHYVYQFINWRRIFRLFHFGANMDNAVYEHSCPVFVGTYIFISIGYILYLGVTFLFLNIYLTINNIFIIIIFIYFGCAGSWL